MRLAGVDGAGPWAWAGEGKRVTDIFDSLRRVIALKGAPGQVRARITDNVHDFGVVVRHDGCRVTDIEGSAFRVPWITCPAATGRLRTLIGTPLQRGDGPAPAFDKAQQCTHLLDLAKIAIAFAPAIGRRRYDVRVERVGGDGADARVEVDGRLGLQWTVGADRVVRDGLFAGHLTTGPARWPRDAPRDWETIEAVMLLRRGLLVYFGRRRTGGTRHAALLPHMAGACFSFQPERVAAARRPDDFVELPTEAVAALAVAAPPSPR